MQQLQQSKAKISSILNTAKKMAGRYGQIGLEDPDDMVQDVMLKVLKRTDAREVGAGWLYKCVHSTAMDAGRKHVREARFLSPMKEGQSVQSVCERADEHGRLNMRGTYIMRRPDIEPDLMPRLKNVLRGLNKSLRQVLVLQAQGHSYAQIAQLTNTTIGTVRSRLHSARKRAKCALGDLD